MRVGKLGDHLPHVYDEPTKVLRALWLHLQYRNEQRRASWMRPDGHEDRLFCMVDGVLSTYKAVPSEQEIKIYATLMGMKEFL